jgi:hypothetical protein
MKIETDELEWILILFSPITLGAVFPIAAHIAICSHYGFDFDEYGIMVLPLFLSYIWIWSKAFRSVTGHGFMD